MEKVFAAILALVLTAVVLAVIALAPLGIGHSFENILPEATGLSWFLWRWGAGVLLIVVCTACCALWDTLYREVYSWFEIS